MASQTDLADYVRRVTEADPKTALEIALTETERVKAEADKKQLEYREMSEVVLSGDGFQIPNLAALYRLGHFYARTTIVPDCYRGKPEDCAVVVQLAQRLKIDQMMAFQNIYLVHGRPGITAKLASALLDASGLIHPPVGYVYGGEGDEYGCQAVVADARSNNEVTGPKVTHRIVKAEGWDRDKKGIPSKWKTMSDVMYAYRALSWLVNRHYSRVTLGLPMIEELQDIGPREPDRKLPSLNELTLPEEEKPDLEATTEETSNGQRVAFLAALSGAKTPDDVRKVRDAYLPKLPDQAQEWAHEKVGEALSEMVEQ